MAETCCQNRVLHQDRSGDLGQRHPFYGDHSGWAYGIVQAILVVAAIWYFTFWVCKKFGLDDDFSAMLSSGVSICGVSAAIATSGAVKGDPKKLSYVTSIVLIARFPCWSSCRWFEKLRHPEVVAGACSVDSGYQRFRGGGSALISETAMKVGVIVKMSRTC